MTDTAPMDLVTATVIQALKPAVPDPTRDLRQKLKLERGKPEGVTLPHRPVTRTKGAFSRWLSQDDVKLRAAIESGILLCDVHKKVRFSVKFTKQDLIDRWFALLYDPSISSQSAAKAAFQSNTTKRVPWAQTEELRLKTETAKDLNFTRILNTFRADFHPCRTSKSLEAHYYRMKRNGTLGHSGNPKLLKQQKQKNLKRRGENANLEFAANPPENIFSRFDITHYESGGEDGYESFSDVERDIVSEKATSSDLAVSTVVEESLRELYEQVKAHRIQLKQEEEEILAETEKENKKNNNSAKTMPKKVEQMTNKKDLMEFSEVDSSKVSYKKALRVRGKSIRQKQRRLLAQLESENDKERERINDSRALAWLRGERVVYAMKTREILIGRQTPTTKVDFDLCEEAANSAVSRYAAVIKMKTDGHFYIYNCGKRYIDVNCNDLAPGGRIRLRHSSLIVICRVKLLFVINFSLYNKIRRQIKVI